jgi:hypothetical protein
MNGFHVKSMAENEVDAFARTEIREPVPGEEALDRDGEVFSERSDGFQENVRIGGQVSMKKKDLSFLVEYARVHVPCMKVNTAVVLVVRLVESHQAVSFRWVSPRQRTPDPERTREGACMRINRLQRTRPSSGNKPRLDAIPA